MRCWLLILFSLFISEISAQRAGTAVIAYLDRAPLPLTPQHKAAIRTFYHSLGDSITWFHPHKKERLLYVVDLLEKADLWGLDSADYEPSLLKSIHNNQLPLNNSYDSLTAEIKLSAVLIRFYEDLHHGNHAPLLGYQGLEEISDAGQIVSLMVQSVITDQLHLLPLLLQSKFPPVLPILEKLWLIRGRMESAGMSEMKISSTKKDSTNIPLLLKLYLLGISDSVYKRSSSSIEADVIQAQQELNLLSDGTLRKTTLDELNIPIKVRLRQLTNALNDYRWLSCLASREQVIVVNIPAAYLKLYHHQEIILEMKMVVGKKATPTPSFSSRVSQVVLYPYWNVPHSIATKELLPAIKRNPGYIESHNFQVLDKKGNVLSPSAIDWQKLSPGNFPYRIRQSTGCDNSLGVIKIDFYTPYSVYLHDTPLKSMFSLNKRYFSHGCMRMEKPVDLARVLLGPNSLAVDTLRLDMPSGNHSPINIPVPNKIPVLAWYNPVDLDIKGRVVFYEDVYKKFTR